MDKPAVTVLTVVRNRPRLLLETVTCIRAQTFIDWEYIIVDDASDDETPQVIRAQAEVDKRIIGIWRTQQEGPFVAANEGLKIASGKYVFNIDSDDLSPPNRIERQLEYLRIHPEFHACISPWWSFNQSGLIPGGKTELPYRPKVMPWILMLKAFASHSSLCIEREALLTVGGYLPIPTAGDYALICELGRRGWLGVVPEVMSFVRRHDGRMSATTGKNLGPVIGLQLLREHIFHVTGIHIDEKVALTWLEIGNREIAPVQDTVSSYKVWENLWKGTEELEAPDKKELDNYGSTLLMQFLLANLASEPKTVSKVFAENLLARKFEFQTFRDTALKALVEKIGRYFPTTKRLPSPPELV